jgi:hypothetical protein
MVHACAASSVRDDLSASKKLRARFVATRRRSWHGSFYSRVLDVRTLIGRPARSGAPGHGGIAKGEGQAYRPELERSVYRAGAGYTGPEHLCVPRWSWYQPGALSFGLPLGSDIRAGQRLSLFVQPATVHTIVGWPTRISTLGSSIDPLAHFNLRSSSGLATSKSVNIVFRGLHLLGSYLMLDGSIANILSSDANVPHHPTLPPFLRLPHSSNKNN